MNYEKLQTMHLFAGAGGGLLADLILGHKPVVAVEWDKYCCQVLRERAKEGWLPGLHVHEGDIRLFDPSPWQGRVDYIHAGFPCQDISVAGNQAGVGEGTRSGLYREVLRVADVVRPRYIFLENVSAIVTGDDGAMLRTVIGDLAGRGFDAIWTCLSAAEVGAKHRRNRWWCLAKRVGYPEHAGQPASEITGSVEQRNDSDTQGQKQASEPARPGEQYRYVADTCRAGCEEQHTATVAERQGHCSWCDVAQRPEGWWTTEPDVGRVAHGVAARVDRIKALGNGQVPLQAAVAFSVLWEMMELSNEST